MFPQATNSHEEFQLVVLNVIRNILMKMELFAFVRNVLMSGHHWRWIWCNAIEI